MEVMGSSNATGSGSAADGYSAQLAAACSQPQKRTVSSTV